MAPFFYLKEQNIDFTGFWFNHNIHPYLEYKKRKDTLQEFVQNNQIPMLWKDEYGLELFLQNTVYRESNRCNDCYYQRLKQTAITAKENGFTHFTSTLFYSKYQNHELMKEIALNLAKEYGVELYYEDWRTFWKEGIDKSKALNMYRQPYCGCIYSEKERYNK